MQAMRLACAWLAEAEILLMSCDTATACNHSCTYTDNTQSTACLQLAGYEKNEQIHTRKRQHY